MLEITDASDALLDAMFYGLMGVLCLYLCFIAYVLIGPYIGNNDDNGGTSTW